MFCPKCGKENLNTNKFCKQCGRQLPDFAQVMAVSRQFHFAAQSSSLVGQTLDGKYLIEAKLGSGGMGDVYRAARLLIGDRVAIKVLHAHLARDAQAAERFRREAVTATRLRHRNVVALYDVGISALHNVPYILMEIAEGFSLRQIINQYRILPLDFVVTVTAQVCAALEEAHRLGIVHRDIKPENINANQTTTGWHVKVLDFGIAKLYNQTDIGLTQDGSAMGTPQYMSPEQCMGEPLDARSDIYSVGIMLYEMLAGTVPFKSPAASAVAVHQVQTSPTPPRSFNPNIPPQVEEVILRALEKRREMRQQTAQQLSQEMIQAATVAFKSGLAAISGAPVTAPDVEPEFEAAEEAENEQTPHPNAFSGEIPVENESDEQTLPDISVEAVTDSDPQTESLPEGAEAAGLEAGDADKTAVLEAARMEELAKAFAEPPASEKESEKKTEVLLTSDFEETGQKNEPEGVFETTENFPDETEKTGGEQFDKAALTLALEDAEHILDELFPDKQSETDDFQNSKPIQKPGEALPEIENPPPDELDKYKTETFLPQNTQETTAAANLSKEAAVENVDEIGFLKEIHSKPDRNIILVLVGIGLFAFIFFIGAVGHGLWYFAGDQKTEETAASDSPASKPTAPPAGMAYIPGGDFMMGSDTGDEYSRPAHSVSVKPFFMDLTEVANEEYKKFVDATGHRPPPDWKNNNFPGGKARFPVTGVNWDDANAYAQWAGKRLPTEEEWEFAAKGTANRVYPWGDKWEKGLANAGKQNRGMQEVGKAPGKSPFGLSDMSGNAWEWTASDAKSYQNGKEFERNSMIEPKIIRSGFWGSSLTVATTTGRRIYGARDEKEGYANTGFRCVKDVSDK